MFLPPRVVRRVLDFFTRWAGVLHQRDAESDHRTPTAEQTDCAVWIGFPTIFLPIRVIWRFLLCSCICGALLGQDPSVTDVHHTRDQV